MVLEASVSKRQFTVDEYYKMADVGIFHEDDRVELIEGEIIQMTPINSNHAGHVKCLIQLLTKQLGDEVIYGIQDPLRLNRYSEPEPDIALLRLREDFYIDSHPTPKDVYLIIEVAETSASYDRKIKTPLYGKSGIPEIWLVDLPNETIEVYRQPHSNGYHDIQTYHRGDVISLKQEIQITLEVDAILR